MKSFILFLFTLFFLSLTVPSAYATFSTGGGDQAGSADVAGFGSLENSSFATVTSITAINTFVKVNFETAGFSTGELTPNASTDEITALTGGRYQAVFTSTLSLDDADEQIAVCIANNGTCVSSCQTSQATGTSNTVVAVSCIVNPSVNDVISILIQDTQTDAGQFPVAATFFNANFHLEALGSGELVGLNDVQVLTNKTIDADDNTLVDITRASLKPGTADHVVINDGAGNFSSEAQLTISRGGSGASTAIDAFDALAPSTTKGDVIGHSGTDNVRVAVGADGQCLRAASAETGGLQWSDCAEGATSPLTTKGDVYTRGASADARIAVGTNGQCLQADSTQATGLIWGSCKNDQDNNAGTEITTIDFSTGNAQILDLQDNQDGSGNPTFIFNNANTGESFIIKLIQSDGPTSVTWPTSVKWQGGTAPTLTTADNAIDVISCYHDGTDFYCNFGLDFK